MVKEKISPSNKLTTLCDHVSPYLLITIVQQYYANGMNSRRPKCNCQLIYDSFDVYPEISESRFFNIVEFKLNFEPEILLS